MSLRRAIVEADTAGLNVTEFCRQHGVSTWFFYDLRRRHAQLGDAVLEARSRAPKQVANRVSAETEQAIIKLRKQLTEDGLDAGPASIWNELSRELGAGVTVPSESTIWRILTRRGFIEPQPAKAPKRAKRRFQAQRANECWQIDATHSGVLLADGTEPEIINIIDDCSRLLVASMAVVTTTTANSFEAVSHAAARYGLPQRILTDNGSAFRGKAGSDELGGLAAALRTLGIDNAHSRPYHPQTCGKVERFHQTQKNWLKAQPAANNAAALQTQLDWFTDYYNTRRPHRAIKRRTPQVVWQTTPHSGPANHSLTTPTAVYHSTVTNGAVWAGHNCNIAVGATHNTQPTTILMTGLACHIFREGRLIRQLTIDPTRRYQPLRNRTHNL